ncbi:hypothetical protein A2859_01675 [Candidatus Roizmanbacteria bacterium RIFCSPHIGHO2_01_FULL_37_16b]|nr:MAG: hypothetical protein A2859_01675 [Candidatus Roizmanbacteria bacterium RIFCSPHIGHO2_01_FULL_37_16b]
MRRSYLQSQSLIELLLTIGLSAVLLPALITGLISSREGKAQQQERIQAASLLRQTYEAVRSIRNRGWDNISVNGTYHPVISGTLWASSSGAITTNGFTQSYTVSDINRDSSGIIVTVPAGTLDPSTKKIDIAISWEEPSVSTLSSTLYLTRYRDNLTYAETTQTDFNAGTKNSVAVQVTNPPSVPDDGEIILGAGGQGDWCNPSGFIQAELNLPQGSAAKSVRALQGRAFTGTTTYLTGNFVDIAVTNTNPPVPSITASMPGYPTNDVFISGQYAYVAVEDLFDIYHKDVVIIDLNTHLEVGYFDAASWIGGQGVFVIGNVGYVTAGTRLYTFDLSAKTGSRPLLGSITVEPFPGSLFSYGRRLYVVGGYAYIAVAGWSNTEMRIINVNNPSSLSRAGYANVNGESGQEVFVNETGTRTYLATNNSGSNPEFFIINTSSKTGSRPVLGSYDAGGMSPRGVTAAPGNIAILVGLNGTEYQVLNISNETSPNKCGEMNLNAGIYGVSAVLEDDGDAYAYIVTRDSSKEFKIIEGGPGGRYAYTGTFESQTFDALYPRFFNRLDFTFSKPALTDLKLQIALADPPCTNPTYTYVGPDGTTGTFFTDDGTIPFSAVGTYKNPGQCLRYKVFFDTTDAFNTPVFNDFTVNYSP